jgi:uncharacterized protein
MFTAEVALQFGTKLDGEHVQELCRNVLQHVRNLFETIAKDPAHNVLHIEAVTDHVVKSWHEENLNDRQKIITVLAALLHEADDSKLFPQNDAGQNGRKILRDCFSTAVVDGTLPQRVEASDALIDEIVDVIDLVSASKNKHTAVSKGSEWKLLVRDADRIEALGEVGIARCFAYNQKIGMELFLPTTPRPKTEEDVWKIATPERFAAYDGNSASMVDHYFDKLLHLEKCASGNAYLEKQLRARLQVMLDFVLEFGRTGEVDVAMLEVLQAKHCGGKKAKRKAESQPDPETP